MRHFGKAWMSLNFYKEYLFGFETLIFVTMDFIFAQTACNTTKTKENLNSHHMTPLIFFRDNKTILTRKMRY